MITAPFRIEFPVPRFVDLDQDRIVGVSETVFYVANFHRAVNIIRHRGDCLIYQPDGTVPSGSSEQLFL